MTNTSAVEPKEVARGQQVQEGQVTGKSSREEGKSKRSRERERSQGTETGQGRGS